MYNFNFPTFTMTIVSLSKRKPIIIVIKECLFEIMIYKNICIYLTCGIEIDSWLIINLLKLDMKSNYF